MKGRYILTFSGHIVKYWYKAYMNIWKKLGISVVWALGSMWMLSGCGVIGDVRQDVLEHLSPYSGSARSLAVMVRQYCPQIPQSPFWTPPMEDLSGIQAAIQWMRLDTVSDDCRVSIERFYPGATEIQNCNNGDKLIHLGFNIDNCDKYE